VGVGGGGEDVVVAVEAATRLPIAVSIFANACSTLAKTWLRLSPMLVWFFVDVPAILFLQA
jgi:hypothetical protein